MANRVFQSVIYQMKDAIDRVVGVVDETGAVISCSFSHSSYSRWPSSLLKNSTMEG